VSRDIGNALLKEQEKLFELWHRVRDGTLKRCEFQLLVKQIRNRHHRAKTGKLYAKAKSVTQQAS
ncbi:hypothetical protein LC608_35725, partial [Nostoc sp. XA010]|uniref:hypothetical protein n=1 Tax=Nostoc sp. XA010 TaxID=2780407 RepID=UPI001E2FE39F